MNKDSILHWLEARKINKETLDQFGVYYDKAIVIPVNDPDGVFIFNKYRRDPFLPKTGPKYWYDKDGHVSLFAAEFIKDKQTVVICEGELDALVLWSHNIPAVTSTGGALSWNAERWNPLFEGKEVYICLDNDQAGANGAVKIQSLLPQARVILLPEIAQVKDVTDYYARGGDLRPLMASAKRYINYEDVLADKQLREGQWQSTIFHKAWFDWWERKQEEETPVPKHVRTFPDNSDEIERAKQVPIKKIIKVNGAHKAFCPFHNEKTPSLHVYPDNHTFCFGGCAKRFDAIDIYKEVNHCTFKEAVEALNRL